MPIKVQELDCLEGRIGLITLDSPATLNALSVDMIDEASTPMSLHRQRIFVPGSTGSTTAFTGFRNRWWGLATGSSWAGGWACSPAAVTD